MREWLKASRAGQHFAVFSALVVVFVLSGCCRLPYTGLTKKDDDAARQWLQYWPGNSDWDELAQWRVVTQPKMSHAVDLLRDSASLRITLTQAGDLIGDSKFTEKAHGIPYLLRAVGDARTEEPHLEVFARSNGDVRVGGGAHGTCRAPMRRRAVVAWLSRAPDLVYVTFVVAR